LLDTGLRVSELCSLTPSHVLWQQKSLRVSGKGRPYGKQSKKRVGPLSRRMQALLETYFALNEKWFIGAAPGAEDRQARCRACPHLPECDAACAEAYLRHDGDSEGHITGRHSQKW